jgi:hypothetical protein
MEDKSRTSPLFDMPATCNYDVFARTGKCAVKFTALANYLKIDANFEAYVTFSEASGIDEFEIMCVGEACGALASPKECTKVRRTICHAC